MFQRIFLSALGAGLAVGVFMSVLHHFLSVPLIVEAEKYENTEAAMLYQGAKPTLAHFTTWNGANAHSLLHKVHGTQKHGENTEEAWGLEEGIERTFYTTLSNIVVTTGFALLLVGVFSLSGRAVGGQEGLLWGLAGFAAFTLAPALGMPPELPGSAAAELMQRQIWWFAAAGATIAGIATLVFVPQWWAKVAALVLIALPHIVGAPHPHEFTSQVPAELTAHFAAVSIVLSAVSWAALGWTSGTLYEKLS